MTRPLRISRAHANRLGGVAQRQRYGAHVYHSKLEAAHAARLDMLMNAQGPERVLSWKRQVRIPLQVNGVHIAYWIADFEVTYADGRVQIEEVKGFPTEVWIMKERLFRACYPDRVLKVIRA